MNLDYMVRVNIHRKDAGKYVASISAGTLVLAVSDVSATPALAIASAAATLNAAHWLPPRWKKEDA